MILLTLRFVSVYFNRSSCGAFVSQDLDQFFSNSTKSDILFHEQKRNISAIYSLQSIIPLHCTE